MDAAGMFRGMDLDGNGRLERSEYHVALLDSVDQFAGPDPQRRTEWLDWHKGLFDYADIDGDESFTALEFEFCRYLMDRHIENDERDAFAVAALQAADADKDGGISLEEFKIAMQDQLVPIGWSEPLAEPEVVHWLEDMFQRADVIADGVLNHKEFLYSSYLVDHGVQATLADIAADDRYHEPWAELSGADAVQAFVSQMFLELDDDGDSHIDEDEVARGLSYDLPQDDGEELSVMQRIAASFAETDADGDGRLDYSEAEGLAAKIFQDLGGEL